MWIDDDGKTSPLREVKVRVYDEDVTTDELIGETYTDNNGKYALSFINQTSIWEKGYDLFIEVVLNDGNVSVTNASGVIYSDRGYDVIDNVKTGSTTIYNFSCRMNGDFGQAAQISQAILTARDYVWDMTGSIPDNVTVQYPTTSTKTCYTPSNKTIKILKSKKVSDLAPQPYAAWDCIMRAQRI